METVYAPNAVTLILSGKAVARAIRAHDLIDIALHCVLASSVLDLSPANETIDIIILQWKRFSNLSFRKRSWAYRLSFVTTDCCHSSNEESMKHVMADENKNVVKTHNRNDFDIHELASLFDRVLKGDESLESFCIHQLTLKAVTEINDRKTVLASFKTPA